MHNNHLCNQIIGLNILIPVVPPTTLFGFWPRGDTENTFQEMVGCWNPQKVTTEPTINPAAAKILSIAFNHDYYSKVTKDDKFFTPEE